MNRRTFLAYATTSLLSYYFGKPLETCAAEISWEPPIYKRFFTFTEYEKRLATDMIVVHHSGPPEDKDSTAARIHKYHRETNGWAGIGYHYLIRKDGMIEQGRRPDAVGAHAYGHNKNSVGICLTGNYELARPSAEQLESLKELTAWLCQKYDLHPLEKGVIVGHRDLNDTDCPGKNLYSRLDELRWFCHQALNGK